MKDLDRFSFGANQDEQVVLRCHSKDCAWAAGVEGAVLSAVQAVAQAHLEEHRLEAWLRGRIDAAQFVTSEEWLVVWSTLRALAAQAFENEDERALKTIAQIWPDHPDFHKEWRLR